MKVLGFYICRQLPVFEWKGLLYLVTIGGVVGYFIHVGLGMTHHRTINLHTYMRLGIPHLTTTRALCIIAKQIRFRVENILLNLNYSNGFLNKYGEFNLTGCQRSSQLYMDVGFR